MGSTKTDASSPVTLRVMQLVSRAARGHGRLARLADHIIYEGKRAFARFVSDETFIRLYFRLRVGRWPNLVNPLTYNEKLQWLKLCYRDHSMVQIVDKYEVRDYVARTVGPEILVPLHGVYTSPDEIRPGDLPDSFVLKPTHGSGWVLVCRDKSKFDWDHAKKRLRTWLRRNYYYHAREWAYKHVPPRIVCEELLQDQDGNVPPDYKVFCFGGTPRFILVDNDRFGDHRRDFFDIDWNRLDVEMRYPVSDGAIERPRRLPEMLRYAAALSKPFPFCRVDFYSVGDRIYFGEITFFPGNGIQIIRPGEFDIAWGEMLELPTMRCSE